MKTIKEKAKSRGRIIISRFRPKSLKRNEPSVTSSFVISEAIKVTTPAPTRAATNPAAELLTIVLTVVVTVDIIRLSLLLKYHKVSQFVNTPN